MGWGPHADVLLKGIHSLCKEDGAGSAYSITMVLYWSERNNIASHTTSDGPGEEGGTPKVMQFCMSIFWQGLTEDRQIYQRSRIDIRK